MNYIFSDFFYNFIPGVIFLYIWIFELEIIQLKLADDPQFKLFLIIIGGIFLGFILQAYWSAFRSFAQLDKRIFKPTNQHKIDRILWATNTERLSQYFSSRASFFGNFTIGSFFTIFIAWAIHWEYSLYFLIATIIFFILYYYYKKKEIDTGIKTYRFVKECLINKNCKLK